MAADFCATVGSDPRAPTELASFKSQSRAQQQILLGIKIARIEDLGPAAIPPDRPLPVCVARQVVAPCPHRPVVGAHPQPRTSLFTGEGANLHHSAIAGEYVPSTLHVNENTTILYGEIHQEGLVGMAHPVHLS